MKNSQLIHFFLSFSKKERRLIEKWLESPFFNRQASLIKLWRYLVFSWEELDIIPSKPQAFKEVFPNKPYNDQLLRLCMSDLHKQLEHYVIYTEMTADKTKNQLHLTKGLRKRNLTKAYQRNLKKAISTAQKSTIKNAEYYQDLYEIQLEKYQVSSSDQPTGKLNLQNLADTMDTAYMAAKLRQACLLVSHQNVYQAGIRYQFGLLDEIMRYLQQSDFLKIPAISVYYYCFLSLTQSADETYFLKFKNLLFVHGQEFPSTELRDLYLLAINYCVRQANEGKRQYVHELMDLYKEGLKADSLLENGQLSRFTYHNIAAAGIKTGEFNWVAQFIQEYNSTLEKKYRESSYSFNQARLSYSQKQYDKALPLLQKANYRDVLLNLAAKTLLLKIYYELEEFNLLHAHLEAMKSYLRRKHIIGYHRKNYRNIIHYTQKLITTNLFDKSKKDELKNKIKAEEVLTERAWFLQTL